LREKERDGGRENKTKKKKKKKMAGNLFQELHN